ncbi:MAG: hypothetical protein NVS4B4_18680 [Bradyrhizobium sp.]
MVVLLCASATAQAATQAEAEAALNAANQTEAEAATFGNRWLPAEAALKAAKSALEAGDWDKAASQAKQAQALAARAVEQSHEQETAWKDAVVR